MEYNIHYASGANAEDIAQPPQLMAGDTPAVSTQDFSITRAGTAIAQFVPLMWSSGNLVPWAAGSEVFAVSAYEIPVGTTRCAVYTEGMFNIDALNWPTGTTETQAMTAMTGNVKYCKLLYSDKRTGDESLLVGPGNEAGGTGAFAFNDAALTAGTESAAYSYNLNTLVTGGHGDRTFALASGTLPSGVPLNTGTGVLSGTVGAAASGNYAPVFTVTDENGDVRTAECTLSIADA